MEYKQITSYLNNTTFCVLIPVYYEYETKPAWRKYFVGPEKEAKEAYQAAPEYLKATHEENHQNRQNKIKEAIFLENIGKAAKAKAIRKQYHI